MSGSPTLDKSHIVLFAILLSGCMGIDESNSSAVQAVEDSGYTNVKITDPAIILGCDENDVYRKRWAGTNIAGKQVHGQVCAGMFFKGWTVRMER